MRIERQANKLKLEIINKEIPLVLKLEIINKEIPLVLKLDF